MESMYSLVLQDKITKQPPLHTKVSKLLIDPQFYKIAGVFHDLLKLTITNSKQWMPQNENGHLKKNTK